MNDCDILIIGSGAGGGTLTYALASTGQRILLLERGNYLPREKANWEPGAVFREQRYRTEECWYDQDGNAFRPEVNYYIGGNTKVYGAALLRLRREDFGEVPYYDGVSPAWPLSYEDFELYYTEAEHLYKVHGERGTDPTEPPASAGYRFPPLHHEPRIQTIFEDLQASGLHPFPLPVAIDRDDRVPHRRPCIRCDTCDGFPCLVDAKSDAQVTCVDPARRSPNVELLTNARVTRLITNPAGTAVTAVEAEVAAQRETFVADIVVMACGAINSAALLLRSANDKHPHGLANTSDQIGRHLMLHNNTAVMAVSTTPNPTAFQKTLGLNDFYFKGPAEDYPLGHIQLMGKSKWQMLAGEAPFFTPRAVLKYIAGHAVDWWVTTEDLPDPENRVTLDRQGNIVLHYTPNNVEPHRRLIDHLKDTLRRLGHCHVLLPHKAYFSKRMLLAAVCHQVGTCRFGLDPQTSVLDLNCRAHTVDNLYVVDGSFFPAISAVNSSLTIIANALRVADHLCGRLGVTRQDVGKPRKGKDDRSG
jgi:choline dehydrogenase-like flavoprotein